MSEGSCPLCHGYHKNDLKACPAFGGSDLRHCCDTPIGEGPHKPNCWVYDSKVGKDIGTPR